MLKIGVIADDFTGATDIASFLVLNGLKTVQLCGVTPDLPAPDAEAVVISHKSRSCPVDEAVAETQASLQWLLKNNCRQIYFKYCSTFDSSAKGNIGPVTDALMETLGEKFTIFQPALPVNGRTVYKGYLFVGDVLLEESGMRNHPITPMTDSSLVRLVQMQSKGKCGVVDVDTIRKGVDAVKVRIEELKSAGYSYAVLDAIDESDLLIQGEALKDMRLVTGGSGLAIGLARAVAEKDADSAKAQSLGYPKGKKAVVFSGSCSVMTNKQVAFYKALAASRLVDVDRLFSGSVDLDAMASEYAAFVLEHENDENAPLVYATANPEELARIQKQYGAEKSSRAVEQFFAALSKKLQDAGVERFIVAGGETSGIVTKSLDVKGFFIGPAIAPGVPWVRSINNAVSLTLKSGNFGQEDFFLKAQKDFPV
ncbi:MAG: four-carbon acid sugar kinase family protein [Proteobacteria bacterium]|uniref:3-oxo-tetronate kinase n=1 Tax=Candidatus Avisuccinivibrio stercorigallinarum TaxID=2840704 RepID=A0A9D9DB27_9GAMM|nr:four-carbon acid sugar kinase family protein [Candidatus Avisuccinivibrio stercorigallinarum]